MQNQTTRNHPQNHLAHLLCIRVKNYNWHPYAYCVEFPITFPKCFIILRMDQGVCFPYIIFHGDNFRIG